METVGATITIVVIVVIVIFFKKKNAEKLQALKSAYDSALRGTDKQKAVAAGRAYY